MIDVHFVREIFIEGEPVAANDFYYIVWESYDKKPHKIHFEYYLEDNLIESVVIKSSDITSIRVWDHIIGLKAKVREH